MEKIVVQLTPHIQLEVSTIEAARELYDFVYWNESLKEKYLPEVEAFIAERDPLFFDQPTREGE